MDVSALERLGYSPEEIDGAIATNASWETLALRTYGRIGRDPARIQPFLHRFERVWSQHPEHRFLELVCEVVTHGWGAPRLCAPEDDAFIEALDAWEHTLPRAALGTGSHDLRIFGLLRGLGEAWEHEPDQRFGQLLSNITRSRSDSICSLGNDEFLGMLEEWDMRRRGR